MNTLRTAPQLVAKHVIADYLRFCSRNVLFLPQRSPRCAPAINCPSRSWTNCGTHLPNPTVNQDYRKNIGNDMDYLTELCEFTSDIVWNWFAWEPVSLSQSAVVYTCSVIHSQSVDGFSKNNLLVLVIGKSGTPLLRQYAPNLKNSVSNTACISCSYCVGYIYRF